MVGSKYLFNSDAVLTKTEYPMSSPNNNNNNNNNNLFTIQFTVILVFASYSFKTQSKKYTI